RRGALFDAGCCQAWAVGLVETRFGQGDTRMRRLELWTCCEAFAVLCRLRAFERRPTGEGVGAHGIGGVVVRALRPGQCVDAGARALVAAHLALGAQHVVADAIRCNAVGCLAAVSSADEAAIAVGYAVTWQGVAACFAELIAT